MPHPARGRLAALLLMVLSVYAHADDSKYKVGDTFPISDALRKNLEKGAVGKAYLNGQSPALVLAFMPTITPRCVYARIMSEAFSLYFDRGLAFDSDRPISRKHYPAIFFYSGDNVDSNALATTITKEDKWTIGSNPGFDDFKEMGIPVPSDDNADSTVLVLDAKQVIRYVSTDYRGQGEELKVVEQAIKSLVEPNHPSAFVPADSGEHNLQVGQMAPDIVLTDAVAGRPLDKSVVRLSDLRGRTVIVSFYPAPFSGLFPDDEARREVALAKPSTAEKVAETHSSPNRESSITATSLVYQSTLSLNQKNAAELLKPLTPTVGTEGTALSGVKKVQVVADAVPTGLPPGAINIGKGITDKPFINGCGGQAISFDSLSKNSEPPVSKHSDDGQPVVLLISTSTPSLVKVWSEELRVKNLVMMNDPGFYIAAAFGSANPTGYDDRTVFIVDKNGFIRYIDWNYEVGEEGLAKLQGKIAEINK